MREDESEDYAVFVEALREGAGLPVLLRDHAAEVTGLREHRFHESYMEFLDSQILLSPRGPEWTKRIMGRRTALLPFCGITLLSGRVQVGEVDFVVEIDPQTRAVVYWEEYEDVRVGSL